MAQVETEALLQAGIAAARAGRKAEARALLLQVIARDDQVEDAWLWMSGVVDDPEERQICLENVLTLNPSNERARAGLRWLAEQRRNNVPPFVPAPGAARIVLHTPAQPANEPEPEPSPSPEVDITPFGCPYCGGPMRSDEPRCLACGRLAGVRQRKSHHGGWIGWLVGLFLLLGATAWLEGTLAARLAREEPLPAFVGETVVRLMVGRMMIEPASGVSGEMEALVQRGDLLARVDWILAALCGVVAVGLAVKSRVAYFAALILTGLLVVATAGGLLAGLSGWGPALARLGGIAFSTYWLLDSWPAFEWEIRFYDADLDPDLRTALDYYNRGLRYRDMGMWAKAAVHWKVASQLAPDQSTYHVALARAYLQLGEPGAARAVAGRAAAREPDNVELRAFWDSIDPGS